MSLRDRLKPFIKVLKIASVCGGGGLFIVYHIRQTFRSLKSVVNPNVLDREKKYIPEYIYIEDPSYGATLKKEQDKESRHSVGLARIWKSLKHSLAWRLLWLCRHGNKVQRNVALEQLASFKHNKHWDCLKLAQALDKNTAVLLARTQGADLRYFLPPPIHVRRAAVTRELLSFKLHDMIVLIQNINPHSCIQHFLSKYFTNFQEQAVIEIDSIPTKPDSVTERDLCMICLDAIHHHLSLFHNKDYDDDQSAKNLINIGLLPKLAELMLRNRNDADLDFAVLKILAVLSVHPILLTDFFQNGLIGELSRLVKSHDVRLSSSAAVCLANLSGEYCYRPGLYLLHPIYRTATQPSCDTLLVHGLRGGVFVTWRQRDRKCANPIGIIDVTISEVDCEPMCGSPDGRKYLDPEFQQVVEDLQEIEEESMLSDIEVVLRDLPIEAKRENNTDNYTVKKKLVGLKEENQDQCHYTYCWPKDWLPKDCNNLRILGVNYWSSLSAWVERCPMQSADIESRAAELGPTLIDAGVGARDVPVVWLTHSMGGLIVKQLLVEASQSKDPLLNKLARNTKALVFYSTPHKGSALATMPRAAAAVLWPSNDVRQLKENSPVLLEIHNKFINYADQFGWETVSFAETLPTLVTAFKVPVHFVESVSADLGRGVFYQLPLDHLCICKPATRQSILYTTVLDILRKVTCDKDIEFKYSNPLVQWIMNLLRTSRRKATEMIQTVDEPTNNDGLGWFEKILLNTFTDGFTD